MALNNKPPFRQKLIIAGDGDPIPKPTLVYRRFLENQQMIIDDYYLCITGSSWGPRCQSTWCDIHYNLQIDTSLTFELTYLSK